MISNSSPPKEAYAWVWLPGEVSPVVAGRLEVVADLVVFNYAQSYLARPNAMALYVPELPLQAGLIYPKAGLSMAGCLRDASPDAWGRRVILNQHHGSTDRLADTATVDELAFLLLSGSNRIGALDFQRSPYEYVPRSQPQATLDELMASAARVEAGLPLSESLDQALCHGTSIGGARPKALLEADGVQYIAKFASSSDTSSVIKAEFMAMRLAKLAGLSVAPVQWLEVSGKDVLLIERFDRIRTELGWQRKAMVSALTLLELDEMMARYASYEDLAVMVRHHFLEPRETLKELFGRMVFNVLCGNTDDHARNHAAFWDGRALTLTPAYDICPQARTGQEASQAMLISGNDRMSRLATCLKASETFLLTQEEAMAIILGQLAALAEHWEAVCDEVKMPLIERKRLVGGSFLNPFAFTELAGPAAEIKGYADQVRALMV